MAYSALVIPVLVFALAAVVLHRLKTDEPAADMADISVIAHNLVKTVTPAAKKGELVPVDSLWQEQTIVLTFMRRFGCKLCRAPAKKLR